MPSNLDEADPPVYPETITIANPGEPRTIESIGGGAAADDVGMKGINNRVAWMRSRFSPAMTIPLQAVAARVDTGVDSGASTSNAVLHYAKLNTAGFPMNVWLIAAATATPESFWSYDGLSWDITNDTATIPGSESSWKEMASNGSAVVLVGDNDVVNSAWPISWATSTGGVATGLWKAIVNDGTNFIASNSAGQFAYSAAGAVFSSVVNGGTNWLAGPNYAAQIAVGKGPDGVSPRVIAAPASGNMNVFAKSDNNGVTWADITVSTSLTWGGIAYREADHTWVAVASGMGSVAFYASTDGGATWVHQQTVQGGNVSKLWLMNDHFVCTTEGSVGTLMYAFDDLTSWQKGAPTKRTKSDGTSMPVKSFVKGGGRFGWLHVAGSAEDIYAAFSQAGAYDFGDPL